MFNFNQYKNVTKIFVGDKVIISNNDFSYKFNNMRNLISCTIPYGKINNMYYMYDFCYNFID